MSQERKDEWTRDKPISIGELEELRAKTLKAVEENGYPAPAEFTCDNCAWATVCTLVFDLYNTNGDCLWEK